MSQLNIPTNCPLCTAQFERIIWTDDFARLVFVADATNAVFYRIIPQQHIKEMSDLSETQQMRLMKLVFTVEKVLLSHIAIDKINLASLGNEVAHIHWHIIGRFQDDAHFPKPIWATPLRGHSIEKLIDRDKLHQALILALNQ